MKDSQQHIDEQIEAYLLGKLTEEQKRAFLKDVKEDSQLAERLKHHQRIQQLIAEEPEISAFKSVVGEVIAENRPRKYKIYWRIAAILVVGLVLSFIAYTFFKPVSQLSSREIAQAYFEPLPDALTSRNDGDSLTSMAMNLYNQGNYKEAIPVLEQLVALEKPFATLYLAVAHMATEDFESAQALWRQLAVDDRVYPNTILWYSALTNLALGEESKARQTFRELADSSSSFKDQASALLEQLD